MSNGVHYVNRGIKYQPTKENLVSTQKYFGDFEAFKYDGRWLEKSEYVKEGVKTDEAGEN